MPRFPAPIQSETGTMPTDHSVRSHDRQCIIHLGKQSADTSQYQSVNRDEGSLLERVRRSTLICCLKTRISASSATRDRSRSITIPKISLHKSNIEQQHCPIFAPASRAG